MVNVNIILLDRRAKEYADTFKWLAEHAEQRDRFIRLSNGPGGIRAGITMDAERDQRAQFNA